MIDFRGCSRLLRISLWEPGFPRESSLFATDRKDKLIERGGIVHA